MCIRDSYSPVLGNEPVDVVARRDDACAGRQYGGDLRDALVGHRRHGDDGLAALRQRCAVYEVDLAADARIELRAQRVGAYLAGNVDLQRRIDGRHAVVLRNDIGWTSASAPAMNMPPSATIFGGLSASLRC